MKDFISKWNKKLLPSKDILFDYRPICRNLLYEDENLVREVLSLLKINITKCAKKLSPVYSQHLDFMSKENLLDKSRWYVKDILHETANMATSGSTTGLPFSYLRWEPFLYFIEGLNHYDLIMDEFEVAKTPDVLYFFNSKNYEENKVVTCSNQSKNFMEHHGTARIANVHYVNFKMFLDQKEYFFDQLIEHISKNPIDVCFAPGPVINSLCWFLKKKDTNIKICKLLSNSNEQILNDDVCFLFDGYVDDICDHMRCWDGGASFFTCKQKTYHLMDNLSWCVDIDNKLVSTDYFSLPCPFVNYWNGDYCRIENNYKRCECGRLYREFEFLENRPFSIKGTCFKDIKDKIEKLNLPSIKHVRCGLNTIDVVISEKISTQNKHAISSISDKFDFKFIVE